MSKIKDRTRWAINYAVMEAGSNAKVASVLGVSSDTVNNYRTKSADPKIGFIAKFCKEFSFDLTWFVYGTGEPFSGALERYPELTDFVDAYNDDDETALQVHRFKVPVKPGLDQPLDVNMGVAFEKLMKILSSGNGTIIRAIVSNLDAFSESVERETADANRILRLETKCEDLMNRLTLMEKELESFKGLLKKGNAS